MVVFDSSALISIVLGEPGHEVPLSMLGDAVISTINAAEVVTVLVNNGTAPQDALHSYALFNVRSIALSEPVALEAGRMRAETRHLGLSLGDRCCLALAKSLGVPAITSDRAWADLDLGVEIVLIR